MKNAIEIHHLYIEKRNEILSIPNLVNKEDRLFYKQNLLIRRSKLITEVRLLEQILQLKTVYLNYDLASDVRDIIDSIEDGKNS